MIGPWHWTISSICNRKAPLTIKYSFPPLVSVDNKRGRVFHPFFFGSAAIPLVMHMDNVTEPKWKITGGGSSWAQTVSPNLLDMAKLHSRPKLSSSRSKYALSLNKWLSPLVFKLLKLKNGNLSLVLATRNCLPRYVGASVSWNIEDGNWILGKIMWGQTFHRVKNPNLHKKVPCRL